MSDYQLAPELLESIKTFVTVLKEHPGMLDHPDLGFFKEYLTSLGAKLPAGGAKAKAPGGGDFTNQAPSSPKQTATPTMEEESEEEPDEPYPQLEEEDLLEADPPNPDQEMGNPDASVSEEDMDKSNEFKIEAVGLFSEQKFDECIQKYTEAIKLNGGSALLFAKRGQAYIQLKKPNACIRDCNRALQINPDSAVAYKFRGRAHRLLGHWIEAANDLRQACKIDFDEQADGWLKEVTPNARKLEEWQLRKKRRDDEKELKLRKRRAQERARAHQEAKQFPQHAEDDGTEPGEGFNLGSMPGFEQLLKDPEVMQLFSDPEVAQAFAEISQNPMNLMKYQNNPKVSKLLKILQSKMGMGGGGGGMPGGFPGGMGGMGGMPGGFPGGMPGGGFPGFGGFGAGGPPPSSGSQPKPSNPGDDLD
jgi:suppressor of tumorigenicity protein 13